MFNNGIMNESLYTDAFIDVASILLIAVTLLTLLNCVSSVVHMMSTLLLIPFTIVAAHCKING